jgi:hypothetical protein
MKVKTHIPGSSIRRCAPRVVSHRFAHKHGVQPNLADLPAHTAIIFAVIIACAYAITVEDQRLGRSIRSAGLLRQIQSA